MPGAGSQPRAAWLLLIRARLYPACWERRWGRPCKLQDPAIPPPPAREEEEEEE